MGIIGSNDIYYSEPNEEYAHIYDKEDTNHFYIGSWDGFSTQHPYTFDTITITREPVHDIPLDPYIIRIIRSVEQLDSFLSYYSFEDTIETFRDKYNEDFFKYNDLVQVSYWGGEPDRQLEVSVDKNGVVTITLIWILSPNPAILPNLYLWVTAEVEKGMLDDMTSGQLMFDYSSWVELIQDNSD